MTCHSLRPMCVFGMLLGARQLACSSSSGTNDAEGQGGTSTTVAEGGATVSPGSGGTSSGGGAAGSTSSIAATGGITTTASAGSSSTGRVLVQVDFQERAAGPYSQAMASEDFAGRATWNNGLDQGRAAVVDENGARALRVTYPASVYGPADGGVQFLIPLPSAYEELYLSYRIRFAAGFDFVRGGKLPGLVGGTHPTGCVADLGGFSARMMWRSAGGCVQYMYYPEKVNSCGDDFAYQAGATRLVFTPGTWHRVQHRIRMNTQGAHDGVLQAWFDGELALDEQAFLYRVATESFGIDALYFSTFFGGSDASWAPSTAQSIDFDDFVVSEKPIE